MAHVALTMITLTIMSLQPEAKTRKRPAGGMSLALAFLQNMLSVSLDGKKEAKRPARAKPEAGEDGKPPAKKRVRKPKKPAVATASPKSTPAATTIAMPSVTELNKTVVPAPEQTTMPPAQADEGISKEKLTVGFVFEDGSGLGLR